MRLGYLIGTMGFGGLELNQIKNAAALKDLGHEVSVFCIRNSPSHKYLETTNLPIIFIQPHKNHFDFIAAFRLHRKIKKYAIEHLIIRSVFDMSIAATLKFLNSNSLKVHYFMEMQMIQKKTAWFRTLRYSFFTSWVCPLDYMAEQVGQKTHLASKKIHVIPSGVDARFFENTEEPLSLKKQYNIPSNKILLGVVGRIDPKKNQLLLLEALSLIKDPSIFLLIIGQPTPDESSSFYKDELYRFVETHRLNQNVIFINHTHDIAPFYRMFDFTVVPSANESVGMVTLESLASGTPVIGSNCGGTQEILKKGGGLLFETESRKDLAEKILFALNQYKKGEDTKNLVKTHHYTLVAKQLEAHLSQF